MKDRIGLVMADVHGQAHGLLLYSSLHIITLYKMVCLDAHQYALGVVCKYCHIRGLFMHVIEVRDTYEACVVVYVQLKMV